MQFLPFPLQSIPGVAGEPTHASLLLTEVRPCRWYGDGEPSLCFVERKTHGEGWKGEESVKERFTLKENQIVPFMTGDLTLEEATEQLRKKVHLSHPVPPKVYD